MNAGTGKDGFVLKAYPGFHQPKPVVCVVSCTQIGRWLRSDGRKLCCAVTITTLESRSEMPLTTEALGEAFIVTNAP